MKTQTKMVILYCVLLLLCGAFNAQATSITFEATVTADNHYAVYTGTDDFVTYSGNRNESGGSGTQGDYNWSFPERFTFEADTGDYIYVVGWSDDNIAQGWIGQFVSDGLTIFSNASSWQVYLSYKNLDDYDSEPSETELAAEITGAEWLSIEYYKHQPASPWNQYIPAEYNGYMPYINPAADWIWGSEMEGGSNYSEYQVFRTQVPVPEPATMLLLGSGLLGAALFRRRKTK